MKHILIAIFLFLSIQLSGQTLNDVKYSERHINVVANPQCFYSTPFFFDVVVDVNMSYQYGILWRSGIKINIGSRRI
ncbi:MAG: hypothetical protein H0V01_13985 [Bacteroidetes bacterium]|nr:hypothetical protein [Bacteroidota bacterium]HET6245369.1 hypothetical protein [Bacteroidia bacterium]